MPALKDFWQGQRQQRQQELVQRRQQIREALNLLQQERQIEAVQLRDDLSLFRLELQQTTQKLLICISQQHQVQAKQLADQLHNFTQALQMETVEFLAEKTADRAAMAQQLAQDLEQFRSQLQSSTASLQQEIRANVRSIRAETQALLLKNQQHRTNIQKQQEQELVAFVSSLHAQVQNYLTELELSRQSSAQQLRHRLQQDRDRRVAEVDAMFQQLSEFRSELRQYRADLSELVWGEAIGEFEAIEHQTIPVAESQITPAKVALVPDSQPIHMVEKPIAAPVSIAPLTATPQIAAVEVPTEILERVFPKALKQMQRDSEQLEETIYSHILQIRRARLSEIESALGINRLLAINALRSLIQKGLVTQRDRVYLIQEEVSL
jgi:gas vesicle GvpC-like protein